MHTLLTLLLLSASPDVGRACSEEASATPLPPLPAGVEFLGTFGRLTGDGEHAYGSVVSLFRQEGRCVGYTRFSEGSLEPDVALLEVDACPKRGSTGRVSTRYTRAFSPSVTEVGPREASGGYAGVLGKRGLTLAEGGGVLPRVKAKAEEEWRGYAHMLRVSECVDRRLGSMTTPERAVASYALNVYANTQDDALLRAVCDETLGAGKGLATLAGSTNAAVNEKVVKVLERVQDRPGFAPCLRAFVAAHGAEEPSRALLRRMLRGKEPLPAATLRAVEEWAGGCAEKAADAGTALAPLPACTHAADAVRALLGALPEGDATQGPRLTALLGRLEGRTGGDAGR